MNAQNPGTVNPFDDDSQSFLVLVNARGDFSLWPTFATEPMGWLRAHGPGSRDECLGWVDQHWTAMKSAAQAH